MNIVKLQQQISLAALLIASAAFVACSSDDNNCGEQPVETVTPQVYNLTVSASKDGDEADSRAITRALSLDDDGINATWATTENIYVKNGSTWATGSLHPDANGATATLEGTLSDITIAANDQLTLQFPKQGDMTYDGQVGTLSDIAANFDYATATITVDAVSATGDIITSEETATFENHQAIVKFTLKNGKGSAQPSNPTAFTISDGKNTVSLTNIPAATYATNGDGVLYVAFPTTGEAKTITLTATVGTDTYTYEQTNVTLSNGVYYVITVNMADQAHSLASATTDDIGKIVGGDGKIYDTKAAAEAVAAGNAVAMIAYVGTESDCTHGLAIALRDEHGVPGDQDVLEWYDAEEFCESKAPVAGGTWRMPSVKDWQYMFIGCGSDQPYNDPTENMERSFSGLASKLNGAGGTALPNDSFYWTSTAVGDDNAWCFYIAGDEGDFRAAPKSNGCLIRACLAF